MAQQGTKFKCVQMKGPALFFSRGENYEKIDNILKNLLPLLKNQCVNFNLGYTGFKFVQMKGQALSQGR